MRFISSLAAIFVFSSLAGGQTSPLQITTMALPAGSVGASYSQNIDAQGGVPPYTWNVVSGVLPAGLTFYPVGAIQGLPARTETQIFTVQVTDTNSSFVSQSLTL